MVLFDFCSIHPLLPWLLPFLLGMALGYVLWSRRNSSDDEKQILDLQQQLDVQKMEYQSLAKIKQSLDTDLNNVKQKLIAIESNLSATAQKIEHSTIDNAISTEKTTSWSAVEDAVINPIANISAAPAIKEETPQPKEVVQESNPPSSSADISANTEAIGTSNNVIGESQLQVLEGIGPKVMEILNNGGIYTFGQLSTKSPVALRELLDTYGTKYRMFDPATWVDQASLAHKGDWDGLVEKQRELYKIKNPSSTDIVETKVEKHFVRMGLVKKFNQDDLKAIEGIGPKIESLLIADGIDTWEKLAKVDVATIKAILDKAGPKFMLADPATWGEQASLAAAAKWGELATLQDNLKGGKPKA
jgi:predicted flap endonuclease-1-like 5' DNA nuclease